nr:MAG: hypothetical protein [Cressdnaviricota sp.]
MNRKTYQDQGGRYVWNKQYVGGQSNFNQFSLPSFDPLSIAPIAYPQNSTIDRRRYPPVMSQYDPGTYASGRYQAMPPDYDPYAGFNPGNVPNQGYGQGRSINEMQGIPVDMASVNKKPWIPKGAFEALGTVAGGSIGGPIGSILGNMGGRFLSEVTGAGDYKIKKKSFYRTKKYKKKRKC